ncbi:MAG: hypothetical protein ACC645_25760 [Pirellulales bacterium]
MTTRPTPSDPFGSPINLGPEVNTPEDDMAPSISADGLTLLYSSRRPGGKGDRDLYQLTRPTVDAPFGDLVNLSINTPFIENAAETSLDGSTLYFASDRPGGFGEIDLWRVRVVPEPSGMVLGVLGALVALIYLGRRRDTTAGLR